MILTYAASLPVVKMGRLAGQYFKPRSKTHSGLGGLTPLTNTAAGNANLVRLPWLLLTYQCALTVVLCYLSASAAGLYDVVVAHRAFMLKFTLFQCAGLSTI